LLTKLLFKGDIENSPVEEANESVINQRNEISKGLIRVKRNLFEQQETNSKKQKEEDNDSGESSNNLVYNKKSMDIYVQPTSKDTENDDCSRSSTPLLVEQDQEFEDIVCSPTLMQYHYNSKKDQISTDDVSSPDKPENIDDYEDDDDDELFIEEANVCSNDVLYNMITEKFGNCDSFSSSNGEDNDLKRKLLISSVGSLNHQYRGHENSTDADQSNEMKVAIGGLYLRNPRGNYRETSLLGK
jgi:hypothetical protein